MSEPLTQLTVIVEQPAGPHVIAHYTIGTPDGALLATGGEGDAGETVLESTDGDPLFSVTRSDSATTIRGAHGEVVGVFDQNHGFVEDGLEIVKPDGAPLAMLKRDVLKGEIGAAVVIEDASGVVVASVRNTLSPFVRAATNSERYEVKILQEVDEPLRTLLFASAVVVDQHADPRWP